MKAQSGTTLVEVIVGVGILALVAAGMATSVGMSAQNSKYVNSVRVALTDKYMILKAIQSPTF